MRSPRIGVTMYGRNEENHFTVPAEYVESVRRAGGVPILLAPGETRLEEWLGGIDGLILIGGGDLDPAHYGGDPHETIYMVDAERDGSELALARQILSTDLPTLGICRGAQVVNVALGGTLHEHLPDVVGNRVTHRLPPREPTSHTVSVRAGTRLAGILGELEFPSASWHHQAIDRLAPGLEAVAHAADGTIEAVEMPAHPWLIAVQWHPELEAATEPRQQRLFDALARRAAGAGP